MVASDGGWYRDSALRRLGDHKVLVRRDQRAMKWSMEIEKLDDLDMAKQVVVLLEKENERLHDKLVALTKEIAALRGEDKTRQLVLELGRLKEQRDALQRRLFGRSSERLRRGDRDDNPKPKRPGHGPRTQLELPTKDVIHELDLDDSTCSLCGSAIQEWEDHFEESEEITIEPRRFVLLKHKRKKGRCKCHAKVVTAPPPLKLIVGGRYSIAFAVDVAVEKYTDHLPLNRQVRMLQRDGLAIDSQTLWDQIEALATHLQPTYEALPGYLLQKPILHADETPWYLLCEKPAQKWYMWCITYADAAYYWIRATRGTDAAEEILSNCCGIVVADGYKVYKALAQKNEVRFRLAYCWAHVRRRFWECRHDYPEQCEEMLVLIGKLYDVERGVPDPITLPMDKRGDAIAARRGLRDEVSRPIVEAIQSWAKGQTDLPEGGLASAIKYMLDHWAGLQVFLDEPLVPLDNNSVERELRGPVVGRKNHYGSRSVRGTEVAALFYSLLGTARLAGVEPRDYLLHAARVSIVSPGTSVFPQELAAAKNKARRVR